VYRQGMTTRHIAEALQISEREAGRLLRNAIEKTLWLCDGGVRRAEGVLYQGGNNDQRPFASSESYLVLTPI
jgi:hypothetical protein